MLSLQASKWTILFFFFVLETALDENVPFLILMIFDFLHSINFHHLKFKEIFEFFAFFL